MSQTQDQVYPWSFLFKKPIDEPELVDVEEVQTNLENKEKLLEQLSTISETTFSKLHGDIKKKDVEIQELKKQIENANMKNKMTEDLTERNSKLESEITRLSLVPRLEKHDDIGLSPLHSAIITQAVIADKGKLKGPAAEEKILSGVLQWLQQRHKVLSHLKKRQVLPKQVKALDKILKIDEAALLKEIKQLTFID